MTRGRHVKLCGCAACCVVRATSTSALLLGRADCVEISSASCESSLLVLSETLEETPARMWTVALRGAPVRAPARLLRSRTKRTSGSRRAARVSAKLYPGDETRDTDGDKKSSTLDALDNILPKTEDPSPRLMKRRSKHRRSRWGARGRNAPRVRSPSAAPHPTERASRRNAGARPPRVSPTNRGRGESLF